MNILELLKNEKVEWKKLGEVSDIFKGKQFNKSDMLEIGEYPVVNGGVLPSGYADKFNFNENTITVSQGGASAGFVNFIDKKFWMGAHAFAVAPKKEILSIYSYQYNSFNRFLFHILKMNQLYLQNSKTGAGIPSVSKDELANIEVPLMSKKTLEKTVETLDKFTEYVTELQAELQDRTLQYNYYRDKLLSEEYLDKMSEKIDVFTKKQCKLKTVNIEEVVKIRNGKDWKSLKQGDIPVYGSGGKMDIYVDQYAYDKPTVLIPRKGSIENVFYVDEPFWNVDTIFYTEINDEKVIPKYFYYFIENYDISKLSTDLTRPSLTQSILNKVKMYLPPIKIQNKIVQILDKFQSLLSDTQGLLPEEIEQRQKQYEYYREKLLTFNTGDKTIFTDRQTDINFTRYYEILEEAANIVGVELTCLCYRKSLDEIGEILGGVSGKNKSDFVDGNCKFITYKNVYSNPEVKLNENDRIKIHANEKQTKLKYGDIIFTGSSETLEESGMSSVVTENIDEDIYLNSFCFILRLVNQDILLPKYAKHLFRSSEIRKKICRTASGVTRYNVSTKLMKKIEILIPPLKTQEKIVEILENFEKIINSIQEGIPREIELRQKQYEYYREKLLSFKS